MARKQNTKNDILLSTGAGSASLRRKATRNLRPLAPEETSAPVVSPDLSTEPQPTYDEIARLAYSYWEARGYKGGSSEEDWLRAEQELRGRSVVATA